MEQESGLRPPLAFVHYTNVAREEERPPVRWMVMADPLQQPQALAPPARSWWQKYQAYVLFAIQLALLAAGFLGAVQGRLADVERRVLSLEEDVGRLTVQMDDLRERVAVLETKVDDLGDRMSRMESRINERFDKINERFDRLERLLASASSPVLADELLVGEALAAHAVEDGADAL